MNGFFDSLEREMKEKNILGDSGARNERFAGDKNRLSYAQSEEIQSGIRRKISSLEGGEFPEGKRKEYLGMIKKGLVYLGKGSMSGVNLSRFEVKMSIFDTRENSDRQVRKAAMLANFLGKAVAMMEGNISPNYLGYFPEQAVGTRRQDEIVLENMRGAKRFIESNPDLNEILDVDVRSIYNQVADRIEPQLHLLMGRPMVNHIKLERF